MREKIKSLIENEGVSADENMHTTLNKICNEKFSSAKLSYRKCYLKRKITCKIIKWYTNVIASTCDLCVSALIALQQLRVSLF